MSLGNVAGLSFGVAVVGGAILLAQRHWDLLRAVHMDEQRAQLEGASRAFLDGLDGTAG